MRDYHLSFTMTGTIHVQAENLEQAEQFAIEEVTPFQSEEVLHVVRLSLEEMTDGGCAVETVPS